MMKFLDFLLDLLDCLLRGFNSIPRKRRLKEPRLFFDSNDRVNIVCLRGKKSGKPIYYPVIGRNRDDHLLLKASKRHGDHTFTIPVRDPSTPAPPRI